MAVKEVQFVLDAIDTNYPTIAGADIETLADVPLERIDRDNSKILEQDIHTKTGELEQTNFVGARSAGRDPRPIGTEYDHDIEVTVGVRIEGAHVSEYGHIDPDGEDGVAWDTLVGTIRRSILAERKRPAVGRSDISYRHLRLLNGTDNSSNHADYYRYDVDVVFFGYEDLP